MSKIINLFSGPGGAKSSTAAGLTYRLKKMHITCDNPYEFPKLLAWDNNQSAIQDQLYVLANQHRGIVKSYGKVDYIILDSPILLSLTYRSYYKATDYPASLYDDTFDKMVLSVFNKYDNVNIFLKRTEGVHNNKERYHNLEESIELDDVIKKSLDANNIPYHTVEVGENTLDDILEIININN